MKKKREYNNSGLTLVELLVVMVISALIVTAIVISFNVVSNANVKKAANRLEAVLKTARVTAMSKGYEAGTVTFTNKGDNLYARIEDGGQDVQICNSLVTACAVNTKKDYKTYPTKETAIVSNDDRVVFQTSGKLRKLQVDAADGTSVNRFLLYRGTKGYLITVYEETGGVEVKNVDPDNVAASPSPTPGAPE